MKAIFGLVFAILANFFPSVLNAGSFSSVGVHDPMRLCDRVSAHAARSFGIPLPVLRAITRTETGIAKSGEMTPWPWTINIEGKGIWFATKNEAQEFIDDSLNNGTDLIDIGCFQINYRWHSGAFTSAAGMLDPRQNALYAASFLNKLYKETGNWSAAVGLYHSRTKRHADAYLARYRKILANLRSNQIRLISPHFATAMASSPRSSETSSSIGSLVPLGKSESNSFISITAGTGK